jgi:hypothetical protein
LKPNTALEEIVLKRGCRTIWRFLKVVLKISNQEGLMSRLKLAKRSLQMSAASIVLTAAFGALSGSPALACGGIFDAACNLSHGGLSPNNIAKQVGKAGQDTANTVQKAVQDVANAINELQASTLTGPALAQAIISSHDTAMSGAMPIPPEMRQALTGYASDDSMNRVRYKIGDNGFANLARLLEQGGAAAAVTLIDVVVFRGPSEANDPSIWAHELTHVDQYAAWGVHSFAVQYTRNWHSVEDPAYAKGDGYQAWAANNNPVSQDGSQDVTGQQVQPPPVAQANVGAFCYTPVGRFGPGPVQIVGSACWIPGPQGPIPGQVGM